MNVEDLMDKDTVGVDSSSGLTQEEGAKIGVVCHDWGMNNVNP